ncbi:MAG: hypothetical protein RLZZ458_2659, partial [Planctomycetota bacterium]
MSFFGTRRHRQTRIYRPSPSLRDRLLSGFRDYRILSNSLTAVIAVVGLLLASTLGNPGSRWRSGQVASTGIRARVAFSVENAEETRRALAEAVRQAPIVLRQENSLIDRLPSILRSQLSQIANNESFSTVPPEILTAFAINPADGDAAQTAFSVLRNQLRDPDDTQGNRIDELIQGFTQLTADARFSGLVATAETAQILKTTDQSEPPNLQQPIEIQDQFGQVIKSGLLADVLLDEQLRETGSIGKNWASVGRLAELKLPIESWLKTSVRQQLVRDDALT